MSQNLHTDMNEALQAVRSMRERLGSVEKVVVGDALKIAQLKRKKVRPPIYIIVSDIFF